MVDIEEKKSTLKHDITDLAKQNVEDQLEQEEDQKEVSIEKQFEELKLNKAKNLKEREMLLLENPRFYIEEKKKKCISYRNYSLSGKLPNIFCQITLDFICSSANFALESFLSASKSTKKMYSHLPFLRGLDSIFDRLISASENIFKTQ